MVCAAGACAVFSVFVFYECEVRFHCAVEFVQACSVDHSCFWVDHDGVLACDDAVVHLPDDCWEEGFEFSAVEEVACYCCHAPHWSFYDASCDAVCVFYVFSYALVVVFL